MTQLTTMDKIKAHLLFYGINEDVEIEDAAADNILSILESDDVDRVYIDDGALVIEFGD